MTDSGQSRKEAAVMTTGAVSAKTTTLMVNSMWRRSLLDVRVRREADASSDHHLVTAKVRLKLWAAGSNKQRIPRYDISRLQDQRTKNAFALQLRNRFQALSNIDEQISIDEEEDTEINRGSKWRTYLMKQVRPVWGCKRRERRKNGLHETRGRLSRRDASWRRRSMTANQPDFERSKERLTQKPTGVPRERSEQIKGHIWKI